MGGQKIQRTNVIWRKGEIEKGGGRGEKEKFGNFSEV